MENSTSAYLCSKCGMKASIVDGRIKRTCTCSADRTVLTNISANLQYAGSRAEYYQLFETGKVFYEAALYLKRAGRPSIVYLHLICQAFENISKYIICEGKGHIYCYPNPKEKPSGKFGHCLYDLLTEVKTCSGNPVTFALEEEVKKLSDPYKKRVFAYGDFKTSFNGDSEYKVSHLFEYLKKVLSLVDS